MVRKKELCYAHEDGTFVPDNEAELIQKLVDEYNTLMAELYRNYPERMKKELLVTRKISGAVLGDILYYADRGMRPHEFAQAMAILMTTLEKGNYYVSWLEFAHTAYDCGDLEICREYVLRCIGEHSPNKAKESRKEFIPLSEEGEEQHVMDVLGMVMEELAAQGRLDEALCQELLVDFAKPAMRWRAAEVPKIFEENAYETVYTLVSLCYKHKAYQCAMRLSGLLYATDLNLTVNHHHRLVDTSMLLGRLVYDLGYMEVAKRCFNLADKKTRGSCWEGLEQAEVYRALLEQDTKLEVTAEVFRRQEEVRKKIESGEYKLYTPHQIRKIRQREMESPFIDSKKMEKERKKVGQKAINTYEKADKETVQKRLQAIEKAFEVFTEDFEVYEEAAYLYFLKANICMSAGDMDGAYEYFQKAYHCKNGKRNGLVLLGLAIWFSQKGRMNEATAYVFRAYIFCGKEFVIENIGEDPWSLVEEYLD